MTPGQAVFLATVALAAGFVVGVKLAMWHVLRCCRCTKHLRGAQMHVHGAGGCQPHDTHLLHETETDRKGA